MLPILTLSSCTPPLLKRAAHCARGAFEKEEELQETVCEQVYLYRHLNNQSKLKKIQLKTEIKASSLELKLCSYVYVIDHAFWTTSSKAMPVVWVPLSQ